MKKEKTIIKMNDDNNYLSLGNFFRIIKEIVTDKNIANQQKIFYAIIRIFLGFNILWFLDLIFIIKDKSIFRMP